MRCKRAKEAGTELSAPVFAIRHGFRVSGLHGRLGALLGAPHVATDVFTDF